MNLFQRSLTKCTLLSLEGDSDCGASQLAPILEESSGCIRMKVDTIQMAVWRKGAALSSVVHESSISELYQVVHFHILETDESPE